MYISLIILHAVPAIPILRSAKRLNETRAVIKWTPLTRDEARGLLTSLEIAYEPVTESGCPADFMFNSNDSEIIFVRENLFEQSTANITGLVGNLEYCMAIQVGTSEGDSGFSNSIKLMCKTASYSYVYSLSKIITFIILYTSAHRSSIPDKIFSHD